LESIEHFVPAFRVASAVDDLKPSRFFLTYENVEQD